MRGTLAILLGLTLLTGVGLPQGQKKPKDNIRFGMLLDTEQYPQKEPKEALASVVKAINLRDTEYLLAHLVDPQFVEGKLEELKQQGGTSEKASARQFLAFQRLVKTTAAYFATDPSLVRDLHLFAKEGEWTPEGDKAVGSLKSIPSRKVFLRKIDNRWVLENKER